MRNHSILILGFLLADLLLQTSTRGQVAPLPVSSALDVKEIAEDSTLEISSNEKWLLYGSRDNRRTSKDSAEQYYREGVPWNAIGVDLLILNLTTGESKNLTEGKGNNWAAAWSPDGRYVAFLSDRDNTEEAKLWVWDARTDSLRKVSDVRVQTYEVQWMPDSKQVLLAVLPDGMSSKEYVNRLSRPQNARLETPGSSAPGSSVIVYSSRLLGHSSGTEPSSDPWSLDERSRDLALLDVSTGILTRITRGKRVAKYIPSPDGARVAFTSPKQFEKPGSQQVLWDLIVISLKTNKEQLLASDRQLDYAGNSFNWSPDSSRLVYQTGGPNANGDCFVLDVNAGTPQHIASFLRQSSSYVQQPPVWDANGKSIYFIRDGALWKANSDQENPVQLTKIAGRAVRELVLKGKNQVWSSDGGATTVALTYDDGSKQSGFYKINLRTGENTKMLEKGECYTCVNTDQHVFAFPKTGRLAYFVASAQHDNDVWVADHDFHDTRRLTSLNPQFENYRMGTARMVEWRSTDGDLLHGALLLPSAYEEGKRYPLIVWVYGGASGSNQLTHFGLSYGRVFNFQLLATRGYAVLLPDAPEHLGTPMMDLAKTVLPGIDKLVELGIADPDRLGIMGHSYGGYGVLALLVQTHRFKAAVEIDGYGDCIAIYGEMDNSGAAFAMSVEESGGLMGGTPWEFRERYIENSPIFYFDRIDAPLLVVHGSEDSTVAPSLGDEVFVTLRRLGKEVEYAKYSGEGHAPPYWSYANQVDFANRMIAWFDDHLKKPEAQPAEKPKPN